MKVLLVVFGFVAFFGQNTFAFAEVQTTIKYSGSLGDGDVYIQLNSSLEEPGCAKNRVIIPSQKSENGKNAMAFALQAQIYNKKVVIKSSGCKRGYPILNETGGMQEIAH